VLLEETSDGEHGEGTSDVPSQGEERSTESIPEILREMHWLLKRVAPGTEMTLKDDFRKMLEVLNERSDQLEVEVDMVNGTLKVKCSADLIFVPGDVVLRQSSLVILRELATLLTLTEARVRVVGFAGDQPVKPRLYKDRWDLAVARSANVVRYLTHFEGIPPTRLAVAGYALPDGNELADAFVVFEFVHLVR
jgi:flagellar motor protein MotB